MMTAAVNLAPVWCITVMFFSFSTHGVANGISTYPWGETLRQRSDKILKVLRDDVSFSIDKDWLPEPLKAGPASGLTFRNFDSDEYLCTLEEAKTRNGRDDVIPLHFYDPQLLSSKLNRRCSEITVDYWTYEWCHERGVSQYHLKHTKGSSADRDPLWSLGDFVSSDVVRERGEKNNMSAAIVQIVELFEGGQWCDETQSSRQSKVNIQCCDGLQAFPQKEVRRKEAKPSTTRFPNDVAYLAHINEPSVCSYELTVCSRIMCHSKISEKSTPKITSLQTVMKELLQKCVSRQEDWWFYEICFGKSTRQFRVQAVPEEGRIGDADLATAQGQTDAIDVAQSAKETGNVDEAIQKVNDRHKMASDGSAIGKKSAKMVMKIVSEFSLGEMISDVDLDDSELYSRVVLRQEGMAIDLLGKKVDTSKASVHLDYSNGTACDLKDTLRSSRVELMCGADFGFKTIDIMDIIEDSTCHYLFKVSVPGLCAIDTFAPQQKHGSMIECALKNDLLDFEHPLQLDDNIYDIRKEKVEYKDLDSELSHVSDHEDSHAFAEGIKGGAGIEGNVEKKFEDPRPVAVEIMSDGNSETNSDRSDSAETESDKDQQKLRRMARTTNRNHVKFEKRAKKALVQNAIE